MYIIYDLTLYTSIELYAFYKSTAPWLTGGNFPSMTLGVSLTSISSFLRSGVVRSYSFSTLIVLVVVVAYANAQIEAMQLEQRV